MTEATQAEIRHIYDQWHESVRKRDLDALMALYADAATFESPLVFATWRDRQSGILTGKPDIRAFFDTGLRATSNGLGRWYRTGTFFCNGRQLTWEYPRHTPDGDQVDLVEMMDLAGGLIAHHRVYWGWVGFKSLQAVSPGQIHTRA
jgi:steroid delta-isomerase